MKVKLESELLCILKLISRYSSLSQEEDYNPSWNGKDVYGPCIEELNGELEQADKKALEGAWINPTISYTC